MLVRAHSERKLLSARTFAASTPNTVKEPEKDTQPQDEFERLEKLQKRLNEQQDAWRTLLKNLGKIEPEQTDHTTSEKPNA